MDVHLFTENKLNIAFVPDSVQFYVIPEDHVPVLRRLIESNGDSKEPGNPIDEELMALFVKRPRAPSLPPLERRIESYRAALNRFTVMVTNRCTLACRYCYERSEHGPADRGADLTIDDIRRGLDFVFGLYRTVGTVMFFGGEPLLRPDLIRATCGIARNLADRKGVKLGGFGVITNGTLLTKPVIDLLRQERIGVTLSCDGPAQVNDAWRMWPSGEGSYRWIESAALQLKRAGVPFVVQAALTPDHARAGCGARQVAAATARWTPTVPHIVPAQIPNSSRDGWGPMETGWLASMFADDACRSLACIERGALAEVRPFSRMVSVLRSLIWRSSSPLRCPAGTELALSPDGWLYPCFMFAGEGSGLRLCSVADPDSESFWRGIDAFLLTNQKHANPQCARCWARSLCSGCMGANVQAGGLEANDALNCAITKRLAEAIMGALAEIQGDQARWSAFQDNYAKMCGSPSSSSSCS